MFANYGFVIPFKKNAMFPYCELYDTSVGDYLDAK